MQARENKALGKVDVTSSKILLIKYNKLNEVVVWLPHFAFIPL